MFENMKNLKKLYLNINRIESIPDNTFQDLTSLEELNLGKLVAEWKH